MPQRRSTKQRQLVLDAVHSLHDHPTADRVYAYARQFDPHISRGTVYRNLALLAQDGALTSVPIQGVTHYDDNVSHHGHMTCSNCGAVVDVDLSRDEIARAQANAAAATGYVVTNTQVTFIGLCPTCQQLLKDQDASA